MAEMNEEEVREKFKDEVKEFIDIVKSDGHPMPTTTVVRIGDEPGSFTEESVANPSRVLHHYRAFVEGRTNFFHDFAEWLWESGNAWELSLSDKDGDPIESPSMEQVVPFYENELLTMAGSVMDHYGGFGFSGEAFEMVFENEFKAKYMVGRQYEVLVPLLKFTGPDTTIQLNPDIDIELGNGHYGEVNLIEIAPLADHEVSGIHTWATTWPTMHVGGLRGFHGWSHRIHLELETDAGSHGGLENEIIDRILTALRLFKQSTSDVAAGARLRPQPDWLDVREGIMRIGSAGWSRSSPALRGGMYELNEDESDDFNEFWEENRHDFDLAPETQLSVALRRFNQTYYKHNPEDRLIDCVIAFEATILSEIRQTESYRFRLPLRAAILLDDVAEEEREFIYRFFKKLYDVRSRIVHTGSEIDTISVEREEFSRSNFVQCAREYLRLAILQYMTYQKMGYSVAGLNQEIDRSLRDAPFNPEVNGQGPHYLPKTRQRH